MDDRTSNRQMKGSSSPLDGVSGIEPEKDEKKTNGVFIKEEVDLDLSQDSDADNDGYDDRQSASAPRPRTTSSPQDESSMASTEGKTFSDDTDDVCQIRCNICNKTDKVLRIHVRQYHKMSMNKFRKLYTETLYYKVTYHRCSIIK